MDKSRLNTAIYRRTHERLAKLAKLVDKPMIALMEEAIIDLEKKLSQTIDRQTDI